MLAKPRGGPKRIWLRKLLVSVNSGQPSKRVGYIVSIRSSSVVCPIQAKNISSQKNESGFGAKCNSFPGHCEVRLGVCCSTIVYERFQNSL